LPFASLIVLPPQPPETGRFYADRREEERWER